MKKILLIAMLLTQYACNVKLADHYYLSSPDDSINLKIEINDGGLFYSVKKNNVQILEPSKLGIISDVFSFDSGIVLKKVERNQIRTAWNQVWGEEAVVKDHHNELFLQFAQENGDFGVRFRAFDDGIGFRYEIPKGDFSDYKIIDELTQFNLSEDSPSWWIPAYAYRRYEFLYANTLVSKISRDTYSQVVENLGGPRIGPEAVQTPFTIQRKDGITLSIHEANLTNYSSMTLKANGTKNLECDLVPWSTGVKVYVDSDLNTPWRTIMIADKASDLPMSSLTLNLNEPNKLKNTDWIKPGKYIGLWWEMIGTNQSTWGSGPNHGAKTGRVKEYIDFGSKYGFDGVLVEGWNLGWDENWCCTGDGEKFSFYESHPDFDSDEVNAYAKKKNIRLVGHHETGTQISNYESQLERAFQYCQSNGIRVVKTGYVNDGSQNIKRIGNDGKIFREWHHGQFMVEHFRKVLETAAKYQVGLVVHEPIKDTGLRRTYPNMLSREGAKGQEFNGFMSSKDNNKPNHTTILPYTRLLSSPMDYTPGIFKLTNYRYYAPDNRTINPNHRIPSTIAKELALYVVIYAPVQMAADLPSHYEDHPGFQFILDVPTDWSTTKVLNGEIGEFITTARKDRFSSDWFLGSITNEQRRKVNISLSFLDKEHNYKAIVYKDPDDGGWLENPEEVVIVEKYVTYKDEIEIDLLPGGGQAIHFKAQK